MKNIFSSKLISAIFILSVIANLGFLDLLIFHYFQNSQTAFMVASQKDNAQAVVPQSLTCPASCLSEIYTATTSVKLTPSSQNTNSQIVSQNGGGNKEFYIPFGTGQSMANGWTDVPGIQAYIDASQYSSIKTVTFEAAIHIPTGNEFAQARLYNVTSQHPVWNSEVYISGGTPQLLISSPITLDNGNSLYQVQMTTQLQAPAILDSARVHILTN